jgi:predicted ATPase/DNA-binding SARP family transcriptional activator
VTFQRFFKHSSVGLQISFKPAGSFEFVSLELTTLGGLTLSYDGVPLTGLASSKAEALVVYLACAKRTQPREVLADLLWDDLPLERARGNLSVLLTSLRKKLKDYFQITRTSVAFDASQPYVLDAQELETTLTRAQAEAQSPRGQAVLLSGEMTARLEQALELYKGPFLQGFASQAENFEAWVSGEQERLQQLAITGYSLLVNTSLFQNTYEQGLAHVTKLLQLDPFHEEAQRQHMLLLTYSERRAAALSHYETFTKMLESELGTQPSEETTLLYKQILANEINLPEESSASVSINTLRVTRVVNIPAQLTPFLGRDEELKQIANLLARPDCRLLTLVGPGGIGKTRLSIQVAQSLREVFVDGVVFVPLASLDAPHQMVAALGEALGLSFSGKQDPRAHLIGYLKDKTMLLVLDNLEHLLDGVQFLTDLLQAALKIKLLVTSRERLNLRLEWLFDVDGLSYPRTNPDTLANPRELLRYSAISLFVQQAQQVQPQFELSRKTAPATIRICQHVRGMPLAIELAAAWVRAMRAEEIEERLQSNLDILATTLRDVPSRHRSLRAVFEQSWDLLSEEERMLFCRLSVFRGGFTVRAAEKIALATLPLLVALRDKSLLYTQADEKLRYAMLEPLRDYALEQLSVLKEAETLRRAHALYYLALVEEDQGHMNDISPEAIACFEQDHDNLRAALRWTLDTREWALGLRLAKSLWYFWRRGGYLHEGRQAIADLIRLKASSGDVPKDLPVVKATAWLAVDEHEFEVAVALFEQNEALQRALGGETPDLTDSINVRARQARAEGDYAEATRLVEEKLVLYQAAIKRGAFPPSAATHLLQELGTLNREQGNYAESSRYWQEDLELQRSLDDKEGVAVALLGLSDVARDQGDAAEIRRYGEECLNIFRETRNPQGLGFTLNNLALASYLEKDFEKAARFAEESVFVFRGIKGGVSLSEVLITLGRIRLEQGNNKQAGAHFYEALELAWNEGPRWLVVWALEVLAWLFVEVGQFEKATQLLSVAALQQQTIHSPVRLADKLFHDEAVTKTQEALGKNHFEVLWKKAEGLPLAEVVAMTLQS